MHGMNNTQYTKFRSHELIRKVKIREAVWRHIKAHIGEITLRQGHVLAFKAQYILYIYQIARIILTFFFTALLLLVRTVFVLFCMPGFMLPIFTLQYLYSNFLTLFSYRLLLSFLRFHQNPSSWTEEGKRIFTKKYERTENKEVEKHKNTQTSDDNGYTSEFLVVLWTHDDGYVHKTSVEGESRMIGRRLYNRRKSLHIFPPFFSYSLVKLVFGLVNFWWRRKVYRNCLLQCWISGLMTARHRIQTCSAVRYVPWKSCFRGLRVIRFSTCVKIMWQMWL